MRGVAGSLAIRRTGSSRFAGMLSGGSGSGIIPCASRNSVALLDLVTNQARIKLTARTIPENESDICAGFVLHLY
jgi:hypothetical protein